MHSHHGLRVCLGGTYTKKIIIAITSITATFTIVTIIVIIITNSGSYCLNTKLLQ